MINVIGLGYIGLPTALMFAAHGVEVVGTACESTDRFDENVSLRRSVRGDLLTIKSAGAYGMSMASRYNLHDLPGAVYGEDLM